mmetsp:Transcript_12928/g.24411  ORF Transcript_12928/g.24411 Transcript_12928/m.24411 type:complete len:593 (-) Transcript_12928:208-1986(-)
MKTILAAPCQSAFQWLCVLPIAMASPTDAVFQQVAEVDYFNILQVKVEASSWSAQGQDPRHQADERLRDDRRGRPSRGEREPWRPVPPLRPPPPHESPQHSPPRREPRRQEPKIHLPDGSERHCRPLNQYGDPIGPQMRLRKEIHDVTDEEFGKFASALNRLKHRWSKCHDPSECLQDFPHTYDSILAFHPHCHLDPSEFLVMHRRLLAEVETQLQVVSRDCTVTWPYWNSNKEAGDLWSSTVWSPDRLGDSAVDDDVSDIPEDAVCFAKNGKERCVKSGVAANWIHKPNARKSDCMSCVNRHPNRTRKVIAFPVMVAGIFKHSEFEEMQTWLEAAHTQLHIVIGGDMAVISQSTADPVFFLHHGNVDYLWLIWQAHQHRLGRDGSNCRTCRYDMSFWRTPRRDWMGRFNEEQQCYEVGPPYKPSLCIAYSGELHKDRKSAETLSGTVKTGGDPEQQAEDCVEEILETIEQGELTPAEIEEDVVLTSRFTLKDEDDMCQEWFGSMTPMIGQGASYGDGMWTEDVTRSRIKACRKMQAELFHEQKKFRFDPHASRAEKRSEVKCKGTLARPLPEEGHPGRQESGLSADPHATA